MQNAIQDFLKFVMVSSGGLFFVAIILFFIVLCWMIYKLFSSKVISSKKHRIPFNLAELSQSIEHKKSVSSLKKIHRYAMILWAVGFLAAILLIGQAIIFSTKG